MAEISQQALEQLFLGARTQSGWLNVPVDDATLEQIYDIAKMGPTSMNCQPMRLVFIRSDEAKARLIPALSAGNVPKVQQAPVVALIAQDTRFYEHMPKIWFREGAKEMFEGNAGLAAATATRNSALQGAYLIIAARAVGLDAGPMSGFDAAKINAEFFPDGRYSVNFICALGKGDHSKVMDRQPRLSFDDVAQVL
ncbi:MAG: malonic semialdehyde reductase [Pigmentiphaga sp.]|nr:malonic semialdehyde reductase [Pigmentiphaga sp.]